LLNQLLNARAAGVRKLADQELVEAVPAVFYFDRKGGWMILSHAPSLPKKTMSSRIQCELWRDLTLVIATLPYAGLVPAVCIGNAGRRTIFSRLMPAAG